MIIKIIIKLKSHFEPQIQVTATPCGARGTEKILSLVALDNYSEQISLAQL